MADRNQRRCQNLPRNIHPQVFLGKGVLKICSKFTREHGCGNVISIKLLYNFIEIKLLHECSPVNLLHIFRTPFPKNTSEGCFCNWKSQDFLQFEYWKSSTAQTMKFSIKDFFNKCHQIRRKLRIWSHKLKKSLMKNFTLLSSQDY